MAASIDGREGGWRIALVDDDDAVLRSMGRLLSSSGHQVETFTSAEAFLTSLDQWKPDVLLVDLRMPGIDGLALQAILEERGEWIPTVFLSGYGDVGTSVRAIRGGALDFLEKPCDEATLLAALARAMDVGRRERGNRALIRAVKGRFARLTQREREVFCWVAAGRLNKQIAAALGTTEKTIKVHRARVMAKMEADSVADLVRMFDLLGPAGPMGLDARPRAPTRRPTEGERNDTRESFA
jgi:FixJ family two-component response regulator